MDLLQWKHHEISAETGMDTADDVLHT